MCRVVPFLYNKNRIMIRYIGYLSKNLIKTNQRAFQSGILIKNLVVLNTKTPFSKSKIWFEFPE